MKYSYLIPDGLRRRIGNTRSPLIHEKISKVENSTDEFHGILEARRQHSKVLVMRIQTPPAPRLIFFEEIKEDATIYVLREMYPTHDEYLNKFDSVILDSWKHDYLYSDDELAELAMRFNEMLSTSSREFLPEEYRQYEKRPRRFEKSNNTDVIIYEMPGWVSGFSNVDELYKKSVYDRLYELLDSDWYDEKVMNNHHPFNSTKVGEYFITFRLDHTKGRVNSIYLLSVGKEDSKSELIEHKYDVDDVNALRKKSAKCYPDFLLLDFKTWKSIEDDNQANLALSEEELSILQDIEYPFFVSGLAGSGKSTILYYLFAHIFDYIISNHPEHKMLFLSYSRKLVNNAQAICKSILCYHPAYNCESYFNCQENIDSFNACFQPFQEFIKNEFLEVDDYNRFLKSKYINYQVFKEKYQDCKLPEKKQYSPDIVWSVIRTFIKGRNGENYFTPEDYFSSDTLASRDRTVTHEDYKKIYKIWDQWYKKIYEEGRGWDDLDLVRYALQKRGVDTKFHKYAIVFCDEAQDFTKVETDLILKLSVHSKYDLSSHEKDKLIPVAFAGDPNQTINPTGFRWGSTQEIFTQSFKEALGAFSGFNPKQLQLNYRSREAIVHFSNTIHYIRHHFLQEGSQQLSFQKAWDASKTADLLDEGLSYVAFYSIDEHLSEIEKGLQKAVIITPDEGEYDMENEIQDPVLRKVDNSRLYTAITAKGLEFKATILYKFSNDKAINLFAKLVNGEELSGDSEKYSLSHFFTKLYIAISRAKQVLYIVDTQDGYDKFWKYFIERNLWDTFVKKYVTNHSFLPNLGRISLGDIDDFLNRLQENYNPKEYAEALFKNALEEEDKSVMNRARSAYREAKYEDKALLCEAYILLFESKYKEAGEKFVQLNKASEAINAFWDGQCWNEMLGQITASMNVSNELEVRRIISQYMIGKLNISEFLSKWNEYESDFHENIRTNKELWIEIVDKLIKQLEGLKDLDITDRLLRDIDRVLIYVEWSNRWNFVCANLYFKRGQFINRGRKPEDDDFEKSYYTKAKKLWSRNGVTPNHKEYFICEKLTCETAVDRIKWMSRLGETKEILTKYGNPDLAEQIGEEGQSIVFNLLISSNYDAAISYPYPKDRESKWKRLFEKNQYQFIDSCLLSDFSMEKFYFISDKIKEQDSNSFADIKFSTDFFTKILKLSGSLRFEDRSKVAQPYWTLFFSDLKAANDERLIKKSHNRINLLEAIRMELDNTSSYDKSLASCFLEMLFDQEYNYKRTERYVNTLGNLFAKDIFFKEDFRAVTNRNKYYNQFCQLTGDEQDRVKGNLRKFISEYLSLKTTKPSTCSTLIKSLCIAYEIAVQYQSASPEYAVIVNFYHKLIKDKKFEQLKNWLYTRQTFNQFLDDSLLGRADYKKMSDDLTCHRIHMHDLISQLSKEDAIHFVMNVLYNPDMYNTESTIYAAKLIYEHRLRRENFTPYTHFDTLRTRCSDAVKIALEEVLSNSVQVDEYAIKILAYTWEMFYSHKFAANEYDKLINNRRLSKLTILLEYLKKRALLHYSENENLFYIKQDEYDTHFAIDNLPASHPKIERRGGNAGIDKDSITKVSRVEQQNEGRNAEEVEKKVEKKPARPVKIIEQFDAIKMNSINIARNLKHAGVPIEIIMSSTSLSKEEIESL